MTQPDAASQELERVLGVPPPWFVGVVNVTPDSFSDGGHFFDPEKAIHHACQLKADGAHIIDIGGESTGPGAKPIEVREEIRRVEPVVKAIASQIFVSVDTYKAETAKHCLQLGARMVNDVSALRADAEMTKVIAEYQAFVVLMYSKETGSFPHATVSEKSYNDLLREVGSFLRERVAHAVSRGIDFGKIICDPGMGQFLSSDPEVSWRLLRDLSRLQVHGITSPMMIGTSRKGFLGGTLEQRDPVSQLTALAAYMKGAKLIRTHNVAMAREFFEVWRKKVEML